MTARLLWTTALVLALPLAGCGDVESPPASDDVTAAAEVPMAMPVTTASDEARDAFMEGMQAFDMQRGIDAQAHFARAVELDPDFALAHAMQANSASSLAQFNESLDAAERAAAGASRAEQLFIEMMRQGADNNQEGALATARALTDEVPESPRAWLALANRQAGMNDHAAARQSAGRALELAPGMVTAHLQLANSYMFNTPVDLDQAAQHAQQAIDLAPTEPMPHDILGDVYRAQGRLEEARDAYTEAANHSRDDGSPYQQRGHVNSFLGDFEAARADYDRSIEMARDNQAPSFGVYRAFVHVHAGDPEAAIEELRALADEIDGMDIPEPTGLRIFALGSAARIALHHGMTDEAGALLTDWSALMRAQAEATESEAFGRGQEAAIAYNEALLAVERGDYAAAEAKAEEITRLVEPDANPRKMEPVHEVRGMIALEQGNHAAAVEHLRQGNVENSIYVKYLLAQALEGAGETEEAMSLYADVASWNFNDVGGALTRRAAMEKVEPRS